MLRLLWTISLILFSTSAYGAIGNVVKHKGNASVERAGEKSSLKKGSDIEFKDTVKTGKGDVGIKFIDDTNVAVSSHSALVIDEFIYDPNSKTGSKLVMNIALGTVRYASGNIAKLNNQNVDIRTPTARIGVLGTAFSMTVDEVGKSLIILLPNKDGTVGKISVETGAGQVIMNQAFQSTVVGTGESKPSKPVILDLTLDQINNLLIIKPPKKKIIALIKDSKRGKNLLDIDFLEFAALDKNELEEDLFEFNELDINDLDVELLGNILDQIAAALAQSEMIDGRTSGFNKATQVNTLVDGNMTRIIRRVGNSTIDLDLINDYGYTINLTQGGIPVPEITTRDEDASNIITIYQSE
tara:strand:+ start:575 stop:1639 length:1065 start_codon:yes stop_codon:yes gene_type:complete